MELGSGSRFNLVTAKHAVELAKQAIDAGCGFGRDHHTVRGASPPSGHILRKWWRGAQVECSTVHRFQGRERDVIILDTVDSEPRRRAGCSRQP
ncbi:MAG TPA: AAA domain-containing protein [Polyangiaceae bacterium]|nr:AAA domain-containing protein [Polyangiaceae bacterium]